MKRFKMAGVLWLVAAVTSALATVVFRNDSTWFAITLAASAIAALVGILLLGQPSNTVVLASSIVGVVWVVMYLILVADQYDDVQAWTANAFFALVGGTAAVVAYRAGRQTAG